MNSSGLRFPSGPEQAKLGSLELRLQTQRLLWRKERGVGPSAQSDNTDVTFLRLCSMKTAALFFPLPVPKDSSSLDLALSLGGFFSVHEHCLLL